MDYICALMIVAQSKLCSALRRQNSVAVTVFKPSIEKNPHTLETGSGRDETTTVPLHPSNKPASHRKQKIPG